MAEYRISIYGKSKDEWDKLAKWIVNNGLFSDNVRWLIQIPRLYDLFKRTGLVNNFEDVLRSQSLFSSHYLAPDTSYDRQISSNRSSKLPKILLAILNYTSSFSDVLGSTVSMTNPSQRRGEYFLASPIIMQTDVLARLYRKYPFPRDWNTLQNPP